MHIKRCFSHIVNLAQGEAIKGLTLLAKLKTGAKDANNDPKTASTLSDPPANAEAEGKDEDNEDKDEDDILQEIDGFDADKASPFPAGSLLFKCQAFIAKVSWF